MEQSNVVLGQFCWIWLVITMTTLTTAQPTKGKIINCPSENRTQ